ncbi:sensor histidine kinase [Salinigranum rubrum]|uniref:sensor histidine kinase n=1 Tax=Salinigranum rubrum TaxID=755307 RepID=UPI00157012FB|nr:HAMP domain-containing sensor histidine kinase [Salinigranum rubrum]
MTPIANSRLLGWSVVFRDITAHKRHQRELQRQNGRLDEFASVVAHDLRNPLSVAQGRVTLARRESDSEHLESATRSLDRIETIVDDTLTLARQGKSVGQMDPVDLRAVVEGCWRTVSTDDARLDVAADATVRADPDRLRHIVENLVRNSVEHGGPDVAIGVGPIGDEGFYVEDNGPGIPEETRQTIFDPAYTTDRNGVGLGLTIVKRIAEAHGWTVTVTEGSMGGARFEFRGVEVVSEPASAPDSAGDEET